MIRFVYNPKVWRHISTVCMALYTASIVVFNSLPETLQNSFDQQELRWGSVALIGFGLLGKFIDQFGNGNGMDRGKTDDV